MKKITLSLMLMIFLLTVFWFTGCGDDSGVTEPTTTPTTTEKTYAGKLEKGAFQKGAEVIAYGWNPTDGFTGESFATVTSDDLGNYTLNSTKIKDVLYVKSEGYFYNENTGLISDSTLKLYGMVDSTKVPWNINVLTHLIKDRLIFLIESGSSYDDAVNQSISELFTPLNWTPIDPGTQSVVNNPELLFLSAAICKGRSVSQISSLLTTLSSDLEDGTIDISMLDDSFYNVDVNQVESNMIAKYSSTPSIQSVKDNIISFRGITGPAPKIYTFDVISGYDFFYETVTGQIKGLNSTTKELENLYSECLITQSGFSDKTANVDFQSFYTISGVIYYSALVDSEMQYIKQSGTAVDVITQEQMLLKPTKSRVTLTHDDFIITTDFYDPYIVSDVLPVAGQGGFVRNIMVNNYFIGTWLTTYGIFYVVVDDDVIARQSGLYFTPGDDVRCNAVFQEKGVMWKL